MFFKLLSNENQTYEHNKQQELFMEIPQSVSLIVLQDDNNSEHEIRQLYETKSKGIRAIYSRMILLELVVSFAQTQEQ